MSSLGVDSSKRTPFLWKLFRFSRKIHMPSGPAIHHWFVYYFKFTQNKQKPNKPKDNIQLLFFFFFFFLKRFHYSCRFSIKCFLLCFSPPFVLTTNLQDFVEGNLLNFDQYEEKVLTWLKWFECYSQIEKYKMWKKCVDSSVNPSVNGLKRYWFGLLFKIWNGLLYYISKLFNKKLIIMWNLNYLCSMWLMFELFEPIMKVINEIWDIIHKKTKNQMI